MSLDQNGEVVPLLSLIQQCLGLPWPQVLLAIPLLPTPQPIRHLAAGVPTFADQLET